MVVQSAEGKKPSVVQLQGYIRSKASLIFATVDGSKYVGHLKWFDEHAFFLLLDSGESFTLNRTCVVGYGPKS
ncbi:MAG: hypothetical protein K8F91_22195 [Candidatus Obscuribacterales bacterium]|nr:hypothetical protein [Candidatus Obscuribacterales bacterium]